MSVITESLETLNKNVQRLTETLKSTINESKSFRRFNQEKLAAEKVKPRIERTEDGRSDRKVNKKSCNYLYIILASCNIEIFLIFMLDGK